MLARTIPRSPSCRPAARLRSCACSRSPSPVVAAAAAARDRPNEEASLLLDFTPNAVHAGIYLATERGIRRGRGRRARGPRARRLDRRAAAAAGGPGRHGDPRHPRPGAGARAGRDIVGVMALVQRPLASVLAQPAIARPRDLDGRRAGVTGLPSDVAVLRSVVQGDGGDPDEREDHDDRLRGGQGAAGAARGRGDGVLERRGRGAEGRSGPASQEFRVDDYGAPPYPELVLCVTRATLDEKRPVVRATIRALRRGYSEAQNDPESAVTRARRRATPTSTARRPTRSSTPSPPRSPPAPTPTASCARTSSKQWAALGPAVRDRRRSRSTSARPSI